MTFLAYYLYGHVNELDGLARTRDLFVAAIGGKDSNETKAFRPIQSSRRRTSRRSKRT